MSYKHGHYANARVSLQSITNASHKHYAHPFSLLPRNTRHHDMHPRTTAINAKRLVAHSGRKRSYSGNTNITKAKLSKYLITMTAANALPPSMAPYLSQRYSCVGTKINSTAQAKPPMPTHGAIQCMLLDVVQAITNSDAGIKMVPSNAGHNLHRAGAGGTCRVLGTCVGTLGTKGAIIGGAGSSRAAAAADRCRLRDLSRAEEGADIPAGDELGSGRVSTRTFANLTLSKWSPKPSRAEQRSPNAGFFARMIMIRSGSIRFPWLASTEFR
jgi:hypothetical protein